MKRRILSPLLGAAAIGGAILGCEPDSLTAAREQLARGALDTIGYVVPLVADTFLISEFLDGADTVSTPDGLLSLRVQTEAVQFDFADVLQSAAVALGTFVGAPTAAIIRFTTPAMPAGSQVVGATVSSGSVTRTITNSTACDATVNVSMVDSLANPVVVFPANVLVTAGNSVVDPPLSLNGASFVQFVEIIPSASAGACAPAGISVNVSFTPMTLASVDLDNLSESFTVEEAEALNRTDFEFDELEDAIDQSTLNSATIALTVVNSADIPLVLDNMTIGAVRLHGGILDTTLSGNLMFETDVPGGNPILITIAAPGQTRLAVPRAQGTTPGTASVSVQAAPLVDRITHILLAGDSVAFVASGTAEASDGSSGRIVLGDMVDVQYDVIVGLDFTIPLTGIQFNVDNTVTNGVGLDTAEIDDSVDRIVSIGGVARVENFTAFGVEVTAAFAPDSLDPAVDVFTQPGGLQLTPITVSAPAVDAAGIPQGSAIDSVGVSITPQEARVLLGGKITAGIRLRLLPGTGGNGRGAIRPGDRIAVSAAVNISIERGGQ